MPHNDGLKGILFDYGGTLVAGESPAEIFTNNLARLGLRISEEESNRLERLVRLYWKEHYSSMPRGRRWDREIEAECNRYALSTISGISRPGEVAEEIGRRWDDFSDLRTFDDVVEALDVLHSSGYRMGVVSQTLQTSEELAAKLEHFGIRHHFTCVVTSESTGFDKPDPKLFRFASNAIGIEAQRLCHVGDAYEYDVLGARNASMVPLLIDRNGRSTHADVLTLSSLLQLPGVITSWNMRT